MPKVRIQFWLDLLVLRVFAIVIATDHTGGHLHEVSGFAMIGIVVAHLALHLNTLAGATRRKTMLRGLKLAHLGGLAMVLGSLSTFIVISALIDSARIAMRFFENDRGDQVGIEAALRDRAVNQSRICFKTWKIQGL